MTQYASDGLVSERRRPGRRAAVDSTPRLPHIPLRAAIAVVVAFSALFALCAAVDALASSGRVHPGVAVGGVQIGGKTPSEALATLKAELPSEHVAPVVVTYGATRWSIKPAQVGASFDYPKLLDDSMSVGRSGGVLGTVGQRVHAWLGGTALPAAATADPQKLKNTADRIASAVDRSPKDAAVKISAGGAVVSPSATGLTVDRPALEREILGAFAADASRTVRVTAATTQPKISDAAAEAAQRVAGRMLANSATVTYGAKSWTLTRAEIAQMIEVRSVETSGASGGWALEPVVATAKASRIIVPKVGAALGSQPVDARFVVQGASVTIVPSKDGVGPDVADCAANLTSALQQADSGRTVELRTKVVAPSLTTQQARALGIRERISTFTTGYSTALAPRVNNIHVLGAALDGKLVAPGDTFSLNESVGQRTAAKGYQQANAIVKGKLVPQMGGGICQVATTLFNAVFMSGLPVVERANHSFYIAHYPMGRDSTVSWGGPDLRWRNSTNQWVLVSVAYTGNSITVSLFGTNPGYDVAYTTVPFTNSVPFKTVKVSDPTLATGTQQLLAPGENGGKTVVTRTVKRGGSVVRTDTFTSEYTPVDATIQVGTKPAAAQPPQSTLTVKRQ